MFEVSDKKWHELVDRAFESMPETHRDSVQNVAIVLAEEPDEAQRKELDLRGNQTLLGLYSGVPLPQRFGQTNIYPPDVITLFKKPLLSYVSDERELYEQIRHTIWHELAHYFGLDHDRIAELE